MRVKIKELPSTYGSKKKIYLGVEILRDTVILSYESNSTPKPAYRGKTRWWNEQPQ